MRGKRRKKRRTGLYLVMFVVGIFLGRKKEEPAKRTAGNKR